MSMFDGASHDRVEDGAKILGLKDQVQLLSHRLSFAENALAAVLTHCIATSPDFLRNIRFHNCEFTNAEFQEWVSKHI